jgi:glycosyltransferase involved in cell wall biosynthesis
MAWFRTHAWGRVRARIPSARMAIVGGNPVPRVRALAGDGVEVIGEVEDVRPWLTRAAVVVVPLRVGGGTRLKILEAMAMAKAVVATPMAAEGLAVSDHRELLLAKDADRMAERIVAAMSSRDLRVQLGAEARACAVEHYRWEDLVPRIEALYG